MKLYFRHKSDDAYIYKLLHRPNPVAPVISVVSASAIFPVFNSGAGDMEIK